VEHEPVVLLSMTERLFNITKGKINWRYKQHVAPGVMSGELRSTTTLFAISPRFTETISFSDD
jgi:hypothetical protein